MVVKKCNLEATRDKVLRITSFKAVISADFMGCTGLVEACSDQAMEDLLNISFVS
jgi:hypothetical protein